MGIIGNAYLEGLQTVLCANLGNPTTIIEFSPRNEPVRTDSKLLFFGMHDPCRIFRKFTEEQLCLKCDSFHACLFASLRRDGIVQRLRQKVQECEELVTRIRAGWHFAVVEDEATKRPYLEYDCPLLGYRELLFPIFFEDGVIGTLFVGQLCVENELPRIPQRQAEFFKTRLADVASCAPKGVNPDSIRIEVMRAHERWVLDNSHVLPEGEYPSYVQRALKEIADLEQTLDEQMAHQRDLYVKSRIGEVVGSFRERLTAEGNPPKPQWNLLWDSAEECLRQLISAFAIRYVVVFASTSFQPQPSAVLDVAIAVGDLPKELADSVRARTLKFNLARIPPDSQNKWITSAEDRGIFMALEGCAMELTSERHLIRTFPVPFSPTAMLTVLVGYGEHNLGSSIENMPNSQLNTTIQTFYAVLLSAFSATLVSIADDRRDKALGRLTHEFEVPIIAIRGATQSIMDTPGVREWLEEDYLGDIWSWTDLMGRLVDNADVYRYTHKGELTIEPRPVRLVKDVIAPAIRQVRLLLVDRQFSRKRIHYAGFDKFLPLWLDRNRFQQVMFNLLSNAIKYAHADREAFRVEIIGRETGTKFLIYARDWGPGIEVGCEEKIFEEEFRGSAATRCNVAGQGLGLWIVRQIIEKHSGTIRVSQRSCPTEFEIVLPYWLTSKSPT